MSVVHHGRTRKYCQRLVRMVNPADRVRIVWALVDGMGGMPPPPRNECDIL